MKHPDPKIFDDIARMAGGAMNVFSGLREQVSGDIKARVEEMAAHMDLVPREDFDRLLLQVEALQKKVDALSGTPKKATQKTAAKPAAKAKAKPASKTTKNPGKKK